MLEVNGALVKEGKSKSPNTRFVLFFFFFLVRGSFTEMLKFYLKFKVRHCMAIFSIKGFSRGILSSRIALYQFLISGVLPAANAVDLLKL